MDSPGVGKSLVAKKQIMTVEEAPDGRDGTALLAAFLHAASAPERDAALSGLAGRAHSIIRRVIGRKLARTLPQGLQHAQIEQYPIADEVLTLAVEKVCTLLKEPEKNPEKLLNIERFDDYVAKIAILAWAEHFRKIRPFRAGLRERLRDLLKGNTSQTGFGLWKSSEGSVGGYSDWEGRPALGAEVVERLLRRFGDDRDTIQDTVAGSTPAATEESIQTEDRREAGSKTKERCKRLWAGVCALPLAQRRFELLRWPPMALRLFECYGVATVRGIADKLEVPVDEMLALWKRLPLKDKEIAGRFRTTPSYIRKERSEAKKQLVAAGIDVTPARKAKEEDDPDADGAPGLPNPEELAKQVDAILNAAGGPLRSEDLVKILVAQYGFAEEEVSIDAPRNSDGE